MLGDLAGAIIFASIVTPPIVIWLTLWRNDVRVPSGGKSGNHDITLRRRSG